ADGKEQRPHHGYGGPVDLTPASRVGGQLGGTPQADVASRAQLRVGPGDLEDNRAGLQAGQAAGRLTCRPLAGLDRLVILQSFDDAGELAQVQVDGSAAAPAHARTPLPPGPLMT